MALFSPYKTIRSALHNKSEATKRSRDRKENGKCTNATNRRSRVGLSTPFYTPKPVGKTAKTSFFSRRAITACSCSFFSLIPPNFTSHTRCMISATLYSFVYYNFARAEAHQSNIDDRYLSSIRGQPIKILRHQSAGRSNRCMKPVQSLFSLVFRRPRYSRLVASPLTSRMSHMPSRSFSLRIFEQKRDCSQSKMKETKLTVWTRPRNLTFACFYLQIRKINDTSILKKIDMC